MQDSTTLWEGAEAVVPVGNLSGTRGAVTFVLPPHTDGARKF